MYALTSIDDKNNLEVASDKPKLNVLREEIEQALSDLSAYYQRCQDAYNYWHSWWPGQTVDGRKHTAPGEETVFPWDNASDTRPRLCEKWVQQHATIAETTFFRAKVQATAHLPFINGREANQGTILLKWMLYTHMRRELTREVPLALQWWAGYGASLMRIGWVQEERVEWHDLDLQILDQFIQSLGSPSIMTQLMESLTDPAQEEPMIQLIQQLSPALSRTMARNIVGDLRTTGKARVPVPYVFKSQPSWTARRLGVDVLVPKSTRDLQETRWVTEREWVTETELRSRIITEDYDEKFVDELMKHRGETDNSLWTARTAYERSQYGTGEIALRRTSNDEFRNQFELFHSYYKAIDPLDRPCVYKTTFSPVLLATRRDNYRYAKHGPFGYDHGLYPFTELRFEFKEPELMSSRGVPEISCTWEAEVKVQRDGRTDATALVHRPPMIVPFMRQQAIRNSPIPGAVFGVTRPNEVSFMPQPRQSSLPVEIEQMAMQTADDFFGIFGQEVDPDWKNLQRERIVNYILAWLCQTADMTFQLLQQFEADDEVQQVVGQLQRPFHVDMQTIQRKHQITAVFDPKMLDEEYGVKKLGLFVQAVQLDTSGRWDMSVVSEIAAELVDPSLVDRALRPMEVATDAEKKDEKSAVSAAMSGIEMDVPKHGNFQLRLQTLTETVQNPQLLQELAQKPFSKKILLNRYKYYTAQIQQYQQNPQIGRTLATSATNPQQALPTSETSEPAYGS